MNLQSLIDGIYRWVVKNRNLLVSLFKISYALQVILLLVGGWSTYVQDDASLAYYEIGKKCAEIAVLLFILTSLPGIFRRFKISHKLVSVCMIFRRYLGISMFLFALIHSSFVRIIPWFAHVYGLFPMPAYIVLGIGALLLLLPLFVTSNDISIKWLGDWWGKIHDLMYIIVWIIFLHVALNKISIWTVLIGALAVAQLASHWYAKRSRTLTTEHPSV